MTGLDVLYYIMALEIAYMLWYMTIKITIWVTGALR